MQNSWLFPYRPFDAAAWFRARNSPRLRDMSALPLWIDEAAREYDLRSEWLIGLAQKEQSAITARSLSQHGRDWLMGFGYTEGPVYSKYRGAQVQVYAAAAGVRGYLTPGSRFDVTGWVGRAHTDLDGETRVVRNLAEAVCLQYTPHWSTLQTVERIWREFGFEDGETMTSRLSPPLQIGTGGFGLRYNKTLHGRSVYRSQDVPGHNVFKGYSTWASNGHRGVGDGLDCFAPARTPVYAMHDGVQTRWDNDTEKLEVIYIEGGGITTVYAHIDATHEREGVKINRGEVVGYVRGDLSDPHLHLEVWLDGKAAATASATTLASKLRALCEATAPMSRYIKIVEGLDTPPLRVILDSRAQVEGDLLRADVRPLLEGLGYRVIADHLEGQGKLYIERISEV